MFVYAMALDETPSESETTAKVNKVERTVVDVVSLNVTEFNRLHKSVNDTGTDGKT